MSGTAEPFPGATAAGAESREGAGRGAPIGPMTDDLEALQVISRSLSGKLELPGVLATALEIISRLARAEGASILLIDPDTGGMKFYIAEGPGTEALKTVPLPPGEGICGYVARTGEPLIVNDAQNDPRLYKAADDTSGVVTRSLLCVPVRSGERLWGVLELINKREGAGFDAHDMRLAEVVATETALSLENVHLHDQIVTKERMAAVGQTVSGLAHCIKNILNGIKSGSAVMDRALAEEDFGRVSKGWQTVSRNNQMLSTLVLDMLALARDSKPHPFPTDLNDLAEQVARLLEDRAGEKGVSIECVPAAGLGDVLVDPTHFYRCLLNLMSNAIDACEGGDRVRVRLYRAAGRDRVTVSVADDGQGISKEDSRKLFTEFFTTKGGRGTGLGLPVTMKLIGEMGGRITFHSVFGRGTRFVFAVPVSQTTDP